MRFHDRADGGRQLAARLGHYAARPDVLVLGLPRGGVPVAFEVASALGAPLDVLLVRKLGVPGQPELAMGAIAEGGVGVLSHDLIAQLGIPDDLVQEEVAVEQRELERRVQRYRGGRPGLAVRDRLAILVDDGLATGATMEAAIAAVRSQSPARIVVAAPVAARDTAARLGRLADEVVCLVTPEPFRAVGLWYDLFDQTTDEEVRDLLERAASSSPSPDGTKQGRGGAGG
jgi:putative phosphoribosyl transferase